MGLPLLDIFGPPSAFIKTMLFLLPRDAFKDGRAEELDNEVLVRKGEWKLSKGDREQYMQIKRSNHGSSFVLSIQSRNDQFHEVAQLLEIQPPLDFFLLHQLLRIENIVNIWALGVLRIARSFLDILPGKISFFTGGDKCLYDCIFSAWIPLFCDPVVKYQILESFIGWL